MTTRLDDGSEYEPDDPLTVILRPTTDHLGPPPADTRPSAAPPPAADCSVPRPGSAWPAPPRLSSRCRSTW
ncbi:hypothetical protein SAZ11_21350 [Streptomyces sp. FXJ1.4098]|nr:hypothetical protein [Streptomyces sp. FXJ1.4098]